VASRLPGVSDRSGHGWRIWHCPPGQLGPLVGGVGVDEQFAGPAEVFTLL
jgi:hypothetical protein